MIVESPMKVSSGRRRAASRARAECLRAARGAASRRPRGGGDRATRASTAAPPSRARVEGERARRLLLSLRAPRRCACLCGVPPRRRFQRRAPRARRRFVSEDADLGERRFAVGARFESATPWPRAHRAATPAAMGSWPPRRADGSSRCGRARGTPRSRCSARAAAANAARACRRRRRASPPPTSVDTPAVSRRSCAAPSTRSATRSPTRTRRPRARCRTPAARRRPSGGEASPRSRRCTSLPPRSARADWSRGNVGTLPRRADRGPSGRSRPRASPSRARSSPSSVFVGDFDAGTIVQPERATGVVTRTLDAPSPGLLARSADGRSLWNTDVLSGKLRRLSRRTARPR